MSFFGRNVVKVTGVYVSLQLWHNWSHGLRTETERESWTQSGRGGGSNCEGLRKGSNGVLHNLRRWKDQKLVLQVFKFKVRLHETLNIFPGVNSTPALLNELSAGWHRADTTAFPIQCLLCAWHTVPFTSKDLTPALSLQEQPGINSLHKKQLKHVKGPIR